MVNIVRIIDISMQIHEDMIVYPENPRPKIEKYATVKYEDSNESKITLGSHTGTHIDTHSILKKKVKN